MLHTTDLMLGNWVEFATGLHNDKRSIPMQVTGIFSDTVYLDFEGNEGDVFEEEEENLLGIPITEEVLQRSNLDKIAPRAWKNEALVYSYEENGKTIWSVSRGNMLVCVDYLHQLQNAYFMLTGKQLKVEL